MLNTLRSSPKLMTWITLGIIAFGLSVVFSGYAVGQRDTATQARLNAQQVRLDAQRFTLHEVCVGIRNENVLITQTFKRSLRNLPRIAYFHTHQAELKKQVAEIRHQLRVFRPRTCK